MFCGKTEFISSHVKQSIMSKTEKINNSIGMSLVAMTHPKLTETKITIPLLQRSGNRIKRGAGKEILIVSIHLK